MFRKRETKAAPAAAPMPAERVTSVLGSGTIWKGSLSGSGGVRIEGAFEGEITLRGMLVIGATGRVTCPHLRANMVIVAGAVRGDITAAKVEIRSSGRVWGDVVTASFSTEEGAFLRGQIRMEEKVEIGNIPQDTGVAFDEKPGLEQNPPQAPTISGESLPGETAHLGRVQEDAPQAIPAPLEQAEAGVLEPDDGLEGDEEGLDLTQETVQPAEEPPEEDG